MGHKSTRDSGSRSRPECELLCGTDVGYGGPSRGIISRWTAEVVYKLKCITWIKCVGRSDGEGYVRVGFFLCGVASEA